MSKTASVFYPARILETMRRNNRDDRFVKAAEPWLALSDDDLWSGVFGHTLPRSWMVWSNGTCPDCGKDVLMYEWINDPFAAPWKMKCPCCGSKFPKNDFEAFYKSGLDGAKVFDPALADRSLLFNAEHPDPADPLHLFGVDDGTGYVDPVDPTRRWRFIPAYLVYGQWKKFILAGIYALANAYVVTGITDYAHKSAILLDRVADLLPDFNYFTEGEVYELKGSNGYVSTWHDSNIEVKNMVIAYDMIFDSMKNDTALVGFLSAKSAECGLANRKSSFAEIAANIEDRILTDTLNHPEKVYLNFPGSETLKIIINAVMNRDVSEDIWSVTERATAVDGTTGEKGLENYSAITTNFLLEFLALFASVDGTFLKNCFERVPNMWKCQRFFIDLRCLNKFYPLCGDTGTFTKPLPKFVGVMLEDGSYDAGFLFTNSVYRDSMTTFLWQIWKITGDNDYLRILYEANGNSAEMKSRDLKLEDPEIIGRDVADVIAREGSAIVQKSVNKTDWHIGVLRSGKGDDERALWMKYDTGGPHGHADGMNLGLFAKGLDIMADFGYPPVQFTGWTGPHFKWYYSSAAHNTVVIDKHNDRRRGAGETIAFVPDGRVKVLSIDGAPITGDGKFERSVYMVDIDEKDSYIIDIFKVSGGKDHAKFMHSAFSSMTVEGADLKPIDEDFGDNTLMRNFRSDQSPESGWCADWKLEDHYGTATVKDGIHLRYTDFTYDASAQVCEGWVPAGDFNDKGEVWIPRAIVRRRIDNDTDEILDSTFVGIFEAYENESKIAASRRVQTPEGEIILEIRLKNGRIDIFEGNAVKIGEGRMT